MNPRVWLVEYNAGTREKPDWVPDTASESFAFITREEARILMGDLKEDSPSCQFRVRAYVRLDGVRG